MSYNDYTYNFASNLKAPPFSFGRIAFDVTTTDVQIATLMATYMDSIMVPGAKSQANKKVKWFDKRSLPNTLEDWVNGRIVLCNSANKKEQMIFYVPFMKIIKKTVDGSEVVDSKATVGQLYDLADQLVAKKVASVDNSGNHVLMDQVLRCSFSAAKDKTQEDSTDTSDTP